MSQGIAGNLAKAFIDSKMTPLLILTVLLVGLFATWNTPREEEPQIVVPMIDIMVPYSGESPREVEERVTKPLEQVITEIPGVEYVYSMTQSNLAIVTARYYVGDDTEESLVKLWSALMKNMDRMPPQVQFPPLIKSKSIDDVPILTLTLWSDRYDGYQLRRIAAQLGTELKKVDDVSVLEISGGLKRKLRVVLDQVRMKAFHVDPLKIEHQIQSANQILSAGTYQRRNREFVVETGGYLSSLADVEQLVVGVFDGNPVYLKDVAEIIDGPEEANSYVAFGYGQNSVDNIARLPGSAQAVTLSIAKRKGADAMRVASTVLEKTESLKGTLLTDDIVVVETRNYGKTASEKVSTLLEHLLGAVIAVTLIVGFFSGLARRTGSFCISAYYLCYDAICLLSVWLHLKSSHVVCPHFCYGYRR